MKLTRFTGEAFSTAVSRKSHNTNIYIYKKSTSPAPRHPSTHRLLAHGLQDITATRATSKEKQALQVRLEVHINTGKPCPSSQQLILIPALVSYFAITDGAWKKWHYIIIYYTLDQSQDGLTHTHKKE